MYSKTFELQKNLVVMADAVDPAVGEMMKKAAFALGRMELHLEHCKKQMREKGVCDGCVWLEAGCAEDPNDD